MCKHIAAVLYGVGSRLDSAPLLLFKLRGIDPGALIKKSVEEKIDSLLANAGKVSGRVIDENGRPVPSTLVEVWQANAAGRYRHQNDRHDAPLDPNFSGCGRVITDADGRYRFVTIRPGAYPWRNHHNAWRPAHIHFSLFGRAFATRLVTQMYFPGDPLLPLDPIFNSTADETSRDRLVSAFDLDTTVPEHALGFRFDIVLRGRDATPLDP